MSEQASNLTGQQFGRLTVVASANKRTKQCKRWRCQCACGAQLDVYAYRLLNGHTQSCGCLKKDCAKQAGKNCRIHGYSRTAIHNTWVSMISRCLDPDAAAYPYYGQRGITVCARWLKFDNFLTDMGEPSKGLSLDRIDNNGNYEPLNCRWATKTQQMRNQRRVVFITHDNETRCITEWAELKGINYRTLHNRLNRLGWSIEKALTAPAKRRR